jgi:signal transduction histidine kinase
MKAREIEELDKLKDEFISIAAHELRAPMTGLTGYLELLRAKITPENMPSVESDLTTLDSLSRDLNSLIDDLLDVSRIEQGRLKVTISETNIDEIVSKVITTFSPVAKSQNLEIIYEKTDLPKIQSDPERIRQVITNLVSNAIKYSQRGTITITSSKKENLLEIAVKDTGIGIPADKLPTLFNKFNRIRDEKTREVRGTGLGLWISKEIVEILGGKIFVQSIYGSGSVFSFTLPLTVPSK